MKRLNKGEILELCQMYETGKYNFKDLDKHFDLGLGSCRGLLLRRGYKAKSNSEINRKYTLDETFFDKIDTEEKAYFLGFLYADGCNYPEGTRVIISLHEQDKEILEKFNTFINSNRPLYYRKPKINHFGGNSSGQYSLSISSKKISDQLSILGLVKAKSLILKFPTFLDDQFLSHFIRGYFDGDGCVTSSIPHNAKHNRKTDVKWMILGTREFLKSIQNIMIEKLEFNETKIYEKNNISRLEYKGGNQIKTIRDWLYKDSTVYLERKHDKFFNYAK